MSEAPTPVVWRYRDRVFRDTFLWRFREEDAAAIEACGETLLTLAEVAGFLPGGGHRPGRSRVEAQALAIADDLEHLAGYLEAFRYEPRGTLSPRDVALCTEAERWIGHLEVAVQALRRAAQALGDPGDEPP